MTECPLCPWQQCHLQLQRRSDRLEGSQPLYLFILSVLIITGRRAPLCSWPGGYNTAFSPPFAGYFGFTHVTMQCPNSGVWKSQAM